MKYVSYTLNSIEEYAATLSRWNVKCLQVSSGKFAMKHRSLILPNINVTNRKTNRSVIHQSGSTSNLFYLMWPHSEKPFIKTGVPVHKGELYIYSGCHETSFSVYPDNSYSSWLSIDSSCIDLYFPSLGDGQYRELLHKKLCNHSHKISYDKLPTSLKLLPRISNVRSLLTHANDDESIQSQVMLDMWQIIECLEPAHQPKLSIRNKRKILTRAIDYLQCTPIKQQTVAGMCQHTFSSLRALQYAFCSLLNCTPQRYLRLWKFHRIRNALQQKQFTKLQPYLDLYLVTNQDRFSSEYHTLFGEHPLTTLVSNNDT